jgi:ubiquinone/menaquinone biosynthesis C-methylase UbiE
MINRWFFTNLPTLRQVLTRFTYEYISFLDRDRHVLFLNHGFADLDPHARPLELSGEDEKHRYEIQLYHHIARCIQWDGLDALEVSSGRGGGACYIQRHFHPRSLTGVDFSRAAIRFCRHHYSLSGLSFVHDNAEALRFPDNSFDVVINLEASLYYPHVERFFRHVVRVLRPNGYFLYADMRYAEELETWRAQLRETGLELLSEEDITLNVIQALVLSKERRTKLIQHYVPRILHGAFAEFAGLTGPVPRLPGGGDRRYRSFVFRKKSAV